VTTRKNTLKKYHASVPWLDLPFGDKIWSKLHRHYQIKCFPTLIVIVQDGKFITYYGSCAVSIHGAKAYPFTDSHLASLEREMDEVAEK
jgi:nucleoredoxin